MIALLIAGCRGPSTPVQATPEDSASAGQDSGTSTSIPAGPWDAIAVGVVHACALRDGRATCFGAAQTWAELPRFSR
ncbi:MAG: hypothetical protein EXR71_20850 [Myxococcales bacterium]|nr:hypothetical protein [Myxococcales bacterium]